MYVDRTYHFGLEGWLYLPVLKAFPVNTSEEGMFSDVPLSLSAAAQTLGWVLGHQLFIENKTICIWSQKRDNIIVLNHSGDFTYLDHAVFNNVVRRPPVIKREQTLCGVEDSVFSV